MWQKLRGSGLRAKRNFTSIQKFLVEIRNETNLVAEEGSAPARVTKLVTKNNPTWDEDFYYNNNVVLDDNISFILRD